jgi:glycosyltransferase 2 family protein
MKKNIIGTIVVLIIFFFLGRMLYLNWEELSRHEWEINIPFLIIAFLIFLMSLSIIVGIWKRLLGKLGASLSYKKCFEVWFIALVSKYIPGKIWSSVGRVYLAKEEGVPPKVTLSSLVYEYALSGVSAFLFGITLVLIYMGREGVGNFLLLLYLIPPVLILLHPRVFKAIASFLLKKTKRKVTLETLGYLDMLKFSGLYMFNWTVLGVVAYFFVNAIYPVPLNIFPAVAGIFALSVFAGLIAIFTPAGLGVREGVMSYLLRPFMPLEMGIVIALGWRVGQIIVELIGFSLISVFKIKRKKDEKG